MRETLARVDAIDQLLVAHAHNWRLERMAVIDRLVLRLAVGELLTHPETPPKVVINEALELARTFSGDESVVVRQRGARMVDCKANLSWRYRLSLRARDRQKMSEHKNPIRWPAARQLRGAVAARRRSVSARFARPYVRELVASYSGTSRCELTAERVETRTAGRIWLSAVSAATFTRDLRLDGRIPIQAYIQRDSVSERDFQIFKLPRPGTSSASKGTSSGRGPTN